MIDDERPTIVLIDSDSRSTHNKLSKKVNKVDDKSTLDLIEIKEFKKEIDELLEKLLAGQATSTLP
jgi:flavorubredoxin